MTVDINALRLLLASSETDSVFVELQRYFQGKPWSELQDQLIVIQSRWSDYQRNLTMGLRTDPVTPNEVTYSLLKFLSQLNDYEQPVTNIPAATAGTPADTSFGNIEKVGWLESALKYSHCVCLIVTPDGKGTGFLTSNGYLFTCFHNLNTPEVAEKSKAMFNFRISGKGEVQQVVFYELDATTYHSNEDLDFAFVRVKDRADAPLDQWGFVEFQTDEVEENETLTIIHHPGGNEMQISMNPQNLISVWDNYIFYKALTFPGSAGAPVFNEQWKVIALHHAGFMNGTIVNAEGDNVPAKRGVLFSKIFDDLRKAGKQIPI